MEDFFEDQPSSGSIFPFLSVLCCVIGTMVLVLIASSLNAAGFIDVAGIVDAISTRKQGLADLRKKKSDLSALRDEKDDIVRDNGRLDQLSKLREKNTGLRDQKKDIMGRTANIERQIAQVRAIPGKKKLMDAQRAAAAERDTARAQRDGAEKEAKAALGRLTGLGARRQALADVIGAPKTRVDVTGEGVEWEPFLIELAPDLVKVHSEGLSVAKGVEETGARAAGDGGLLDSLARELARPGVKRFAVLLVRPGAIELHDEAERRMRKWRVPFTREPVEAEWEIAFD